jgi:hypothetical protein
MFVFDWTLITWEDYSTVTDLITYQQYKNIAMQQFDKHLAIRTGNNNGYVMLVDV